MHQARDLEHYLDFMKAPLLIVNTMAKDAKFAFKCAFHENI